MNPASSFRLPFYCGKLDESSGAGRSVRRRRLWLLPVFIVLLLAAACLGGSTTALAAEEDEPQVSMAVTLQDGRKNAYISWERVPGAVSYEIQRTGKENGKFKTIASLGGSRRKYTDRDVKRGSYYDYRVAARMDDDTCFYSKTAAFACPLSSVEGVKLTRYSSSSIKVSWNKSSGAQYYRVYCSKKKGEYTRVKTTDKTWFRVKNLDNDQKYYFYVRSCAGKSYSKLDSEMSKAVTMRTKDFTRTTVFAGDSITTGLTVYNILPGMDISGNKHVVADIGLNTTTFRTRRVFGGMSGLERVIAYKPYRVYMMLGINEIHYRSSSDVAAGYQEILNAIRQGSPDTDIVLLAVSPVTLSEQQRRSGFAQIPDFNAKLSAIAQNLGIKYYDYTGFLKDAGGCLNSALSAGDGVHWTVSAYHSFAQTMAEYDKSQD